VQRGGARMTAGTASWQEAWLVQHSQDWHVSVSLYYVSPRPVNLHLACFYHAPCGWIGWCGPSHGLRM
jgi:hypothetical protein